MIRKLICYFFKKEIINKYQQIGFKKRTLLKLFNTLKYGELTCEICKRKLGKGYHPTIDHIIPKFKGGTNDIENLRLAHYHCNTKRKDY